MPNKRKTPIFTGDNLPSLVNELVESFINGNRTYVYDEITRLPKIAAMAIVGYMCDYLHDYQDPYPYRVFLRMLSDKL